MANHGIITIGASAGGVEALRQLVAGLPADLPASVFVAVHTAREAKEALAEILSRSGPMPAEMATDHQEMQRGTIYVAPPDYHLMIDRRFMYLTHGPRENLVRPAIDPLFRSAAVVHGSHVIGVVLSGNLDDGTAGLLAIKRCGGIAVVQDPRDALYSDMPTSALQTVDVDTCAALSDLPSLLTHMAHNPPGPPTSVPPDLLAEVEMSRTESGDIGVLNEIGKITSLRCSECGGPLWQVKDDKMTRFRCFVGHSFTARSLATELTDGVEKSMWVSVQMLYERAHMLERLAASDTQKHREQDAASFRDKAVATREQADRMRRFLLSVNL